MRRLDSTVRFRIVFHGCLAEEVSSWLSGYPALNPPCTPPSISKNRTPPLEMPPCELENNRNDLDAFRPKNLKTSGEKI